MTEENQFQRAYSPFCLPAFPSSKSRSFLPFATLAAFYFLFPFFLFPFPWQRRKKGSICPYWYGGDASLRRIV
jgi:hypothetical protein